MKPKTSNALLAFLHAMRVTADFNVHDPGVGAEARRARALLSFALHELSLALLFTTTICEARIADALPLMITLKSEAEALGKIIANVGRRLGPTDREMRGAVGEAEAALHALVAGDHATVGGKAGLVVASAGKARGFSAGKSNPAVVRGEREVRRLVLLDLRQERAAVFAERTQRALRSAGVPAGEGRDSLETAHKALRAKVSPLLGPTFGGASSEDEAGAAREALLYVSVALIEAQGGR